MLSLAAPSSCLKGLALIAGPLMCAIAACSFVDQEEEIEGPRVCPEGGRSSRGDVRVVIPPLGLSSRSFPLVEASNANTVHTK
jgi:predicted Zn-ribbon and HTH transcriptional regulator